MRRVRVARVRRGRGVWRREPSQFRGCGFSRARSCVNTARPNPRWRGTRIWCLATPRTIATCTRAAETSRRATSDRVDPRRSASAETALRFRVEAYRNRGSAAAACSKPPPRTSRRWKACAASSRARANSSNASATSSRRATNSSWPPRAFAFDAATRWPVRGTPGPVPEHLRASVVHEWELDDMDEGYAADRAAYEADLRRAASQVRFLERLRSEDADESDGERPRRRRRGARARSSARCATRTWTDPPPPRNSRCYPAGTDCACRAWTRS